MVGYDANFINTLADEHRCPVCNLALREPMQTGCGHRLCKECYQQLQDKNDDITCPVDGSTVNPEQVYPDNYGKREVLNLETFCKYRNNGCQWKGSLRDYEDHTRTCELQDTECPNDCGHKCNKFLMEKHLAETCPFRSVTCEYCKIILGMADIQDHYDVCELYPIDCKYNCGELKIPRKMLQEHFEKSCMNSEGACPLFYCGCTFRGTKEEISEHLKGDAVEHIMKASQYANSIELKAGELNKKIESEARRAATLKEAIVRQDLEFESTKKQYVGIQRTLDSLEKDIGDIKQRGNYIQENLVLLGKKSGPSMTRDIDNLKVQAREMEQKIELIMKRVAEGVQISKMQMTGNSGPVSLPSGGRLGANGELEKRADKIDNQLALQDVQMAELNLKLQLLESTSYDGTLIWKIDNYHRRKQDAVIGKTPSLYSPPFYTSRFGYKLCSRIYLNGDGQGKGSHISLFFVVMRSEYDALLDWPFPCKITMKMLAQEGNANISEAFRPDPNSSSFRRPTSEMNIASGVPLFVSQQKVASGPYVKKDSIFIQVIVDTNSIPNTHTI